MKKLCLLVFVLAFALCACTPLNNESVITDDNSSQSNTSSAAEDNSLTVSIGDITKGEISHTGESSAESSEPDSSAPESSESSAAAPESETSEPESEPESEPSAPESSESSEAAVSPAEISEDVNSIEFSEQSVLVKGSGVSANGCVVTISAGGTYYVSGKCGDCRIIVETDKDSEVELVLCGVDLTCTNSAVIYGISSDKLKLNAENGTVNVLTDGGSYVGVVDEKPNTCVFSCDDITITGGGTLTINGNYNNGLSSTNDINIKSDVTLNVSAVNTGIRGKDSVEIDDGAAVTVVSSGDGIKSSNADEDGEGIILIHGGNVTVTAAEDGIEAATDLTIEGGKLLITTGNGSGSTLTSDMTAKGLKSDGTINIKGGDICVNSCDDSLHCAGNCTISGGVVAVTSGDDGIHTDSDLFISGGYVYIEKSYEGLEGKNITVSGGEVSVTASDDGMNAAGGSDTQGMGRPGYNPFGGGSTGDYKITISGGKINVNSSGDGVDSNGNIEMSGGTLLVSGPTNSGNGALDYVGSFTLTGGTLVAAGASGMAMNVSQTSTQCSVLYNTTSCAAGSEITLTDENGDILISFTPAKVFGSVVVSVPEITKNKTYCIKIGTNNTQSFTVSAVLTSLGSGGGGFGGGGRRP